MRVIGGSAKGHRLLSVPGDTTRPILDRVKTSLFDILRPELEGATFLDLFAGSGGVGIEALSQGASRATFIDLAPKAIQTIKKNLAATGFLSAAEVRQRDAFSFLRNCSRSYHFVYVAPPQYKSLWIEAMQHLAERPDLLEPDGQVIVQIDPKEYEELELRSFSEKTQRKYGNTLLVFYEKISGR